MKLGAATFSYLYEGDLDEALRRLATLGIKQVQLTISPPHIWPREMDTSERKEVVRMLSKHGVQAKNVNQRFADVNVASINPGIRAETIRQIKEDIQLAVDLNARDVVVVVGKPTPLYSPPIEEIWDLAREAIEECVAVARSEGVNCVIENTGYSLCPTAADLRRLALEINDPHCRIHYDVANANLYEDPVKGIRELGDGLLASVDLSDNDGQVWTHSPIGTGNIDFKGVYSALADIGFEETAWLEINVYEKQDEYTSDAIETLTKLGFEL